MALHNCLVYITHKERNISELWTQTCLDHRRCIYKCRSKVLCYTKCLNLVGSGKWEELALQLLNKRYTENELI